MQTLRVLLFGLMGVLSIWVGRTFEEQALLFAYSCVLGLLAEGAIQIWMTMKAYEFAADKMSERVGKLVDVFSELSGHLAKISALEGQRHRGNRLM